MYARKALLTCKYYRNVALHRPISMNLEVTRRCNASCDFCDYWKTKQEKALSDYAPIVKKVDPMMVTVTGGEPLLRLDVAEIVRRIHEEVPVIYVAMVTNASLLTLDKARELHEAGVNQISVSVDFLDERHDKSRGIPGLWKKLSETVPKLPGIGFDAVNLNWVIMEENYDQTLEAARLARDWGVRVTYSSYSDLKSMNEKHFLSQKNLDGFPTMIEEILDFKRRHRNIRSSDYFLSLMPAYYRHEPIPDCPAGLRWVHVTPEGWIKPCSELPPVVFWENYDPKNSFGKQDCTACWFSCRGEAQTPINLKRIREFL